MSKSLRKTIVKSGCIMGKPVQLILGRCQLEREQANCGMFLYLYGRLIEMFLWFLYLTFNALFFSPLFPLFLHWCSSCSYRLTRELVAWFTMVIVNVVSLVLLMLQGWWYRCYGSVALIFNMYLQLYMLECNYTRFIIFLLLHAYFEVYDMSMLWVRR